MSLEQFYITGLIVSILLSILSTKNKKKNENKNIPFRVRPINRDSEPINNGNAQVTPNSAV